MFYILYIKTRFLSRTSLFLFYLFVYLTVYICVCKRWKNFNKIIFYGFFDNSPYCMIIIVNTIYLEPTSSILNFSLPKQTHRTRAHVLKKFRFINLAHRLLATAYFAAVFADQLQNTIAARNCLRNLRTASCKLVRVRTQKLPYATSG